MPTEHIAIIACFVYSGILYIIATGKVARLRKLVEDLHVYRAQLSGEQLIIKEMIRKSIQTIPPRNMVVALGGSCETKRVRGGFTSTAILGENTFTTGGEKCDDENIDRCENNACREVLKNVHVSMMTPYR